MSNADRRSKKSASRIGREVLGVTTLDLARTRARPHWCVRRWWWWRWRSALRFVPRRSPGRNGGGLVVNRTGRGLALNENHAAPPVAAPLVREHKKRAPAAAQRACSAGAACTRASAVVTLVVFLCDLCPEHTSSLAQPQRRRRVCSHRRRVLRVRGWRSRSVLSAGASSRRRTRARSSSRARCAAAAR